MNIKHKIWKRKYLPKKVLFIRLQAMGDTIIALPYIRGFRKAYPEIEIHYLIRQEDAQIPKSVGIFDKVWILKGGRNQYLQLLHLLLLIPGLIVNGYDIVYDLQNNRISNILRMFIKSEAWCAFDKFSAFPAGDRYYETIKSIGLNKFSPLFQKYSLHNTFSDNLLKNPKCKKLKVVVNPAGLYTNRNWPAPNYIDWARKLLNHYKGEVCFIFLGIDRVAQKAEGFANLFPDNTINLVGKTSPLEAFSILQHADFILSEDSGLMHMAWTSGVKTLAIFGSTRSDWSRPLGDHSVLLDASELACAGCLQPSCKFGDNRCMSIHSPDKVFDETIKLLTCE